jgi:hypothetical protein
MSHGSGIVQSSSDGTGRKETTSHPSAEVKESSMTLSLFEKPPDRGEAIELLHAATALYTTAQVVDVLLDRLNWPESGKRLLDPSAGDGSFLVQALDRLDLSDRNSISRLRGWEIHPGAIEAARARIIERLRQSGWSKRTRAPAPLRFWSTKIS